MGDQTYFPKSKVLLVATDEVICRLLAEYLSDMIGFEVWFADTVGKAAAMIAENDFLLVFLDWELASDNGDEVFGCVMPSGKSPFVVLLIDESTSFDFSYTVGAFFLKPFTVKDLNSVILKVLSDG